MLRISGLLFLILTFPTVMQADPLALGGAFSHANAEYLGQLQHPALKESSGLAASIRHPGILWTHNDSGGKPRLFASTLAGRHMAVLHISNAQNWDWEDMAAFRYQGKAWLLIADIGDNRAWRKKCTLYVVPEPDLNLQAPGQNLTACADWKIVFTYEDGPRDAEAVAVDPVSEQILIISKRTRPPAVYTLPLIYPAAYPKKKTLLARRTNLLTQIPGPHVKDASPHSRSRKLLFQPTAMDLSPDRRWAVVITYRSAYFFSRTRSQTWQEAFRSPPKIMPLPERSQGESGCFTSDGRKIVIGTEGRPSPLWRLAVPPVHQ